MAVTFECICASSALDADRTLSTLDRFWIVVPIDCPIFRFVFGVDVFNLKFRVVNAADVLDRVGMSLDRFFDLCQKEI